MFNKTLDCFCLRQCLQRDINYLKKNLLKASQIQSEVDLSLITENCIEVYKEHLHALCKLTLYKLFFRRSLAVVILRVFSSHRAC